MMYLEHCYLVCFWKTGKHNFVYLINRLHMAPANDDDFLIGHKEQIVSGLLTVAKKGSRKIRVVILYKAACDWFIIKMN